MLTDLHLRTTEYACIIAMVTVIIFGDYLLAGYGENRVDELSEGECYEMKFFSL